MSKNFDFDLDDPLGDLLSDNSNDSFYNDDKGKSSIKVQLSRNASLDKKKSNLFGLYSDQPVKEIKNTSGDDWLGLSDTPKESKINIIERPSTSTGAKNNSSKKEFRSTEDLQSITKPAKSSFPDNLNFLDDLGLSDEPIVKQPLTKSSSKPSLLDDILGKTPSSIKTVETPLYKAENANPTGYSPSALSAPISRNVKLSSSGSKIDGNIGVLETKQSLKAKSATELSKPVKKDNVNTRRQRANVDWLGLYPNESHDLNNPAEDSKHDDLPDWLKSSGNDTTKAQNISKPVTPSEAKKEQTETVFEKQIYSNLTSNQLNVPEILNVNSNLNLLNNSELEQQSAAICLQQQESQLLVALQLKAQEERLAALQERQEESRRVQREVVSAHRQQLDQILTGQAGHRMQLQNVIMQHQQRINSHIQSLLRPSSASADNNVEKELTPMADEINLEVNIAEGYTANEGTKKVSERIQLEQMILNLKGNHTKELEMMENSYRHQIHLANESLITVEERLKNENEKVTSYYVMRIERLEEENLRILEQCDARVQDLLRRQVIDTEAREIKYQRDMDMLQEQYQKVILNIRESTNIEQTTIRDVTEYSQKLNLIMKDVERNNEVCHSLVHKMESRMTEEIANKESDLMTKEKQVNYLMECLTSQRKNIEIESQESRSTLKTLEDTLKQQILAIEDGKRSIKGKRMELETEKELHTNEIEKQKRFFENEKDIWMRHIKMSEERQAELEAQLKERLSKLEQDKQDIANQHRAVNDLRSKTEALKQSIEKELLDIKESKENLFSNQQKLNLAEMAQTARSQELEVLTRSALAKHALAERKMAEADFAQQKYEDKLKRIQDQAISLNAREQQISRDKIALSRERLMFHNIQKDSQYNQCGLCKASLMHQSYSKHRSVDVNNYSELPENVNFFLESSVTRDRSSHFDFPAKFAEGVSKKVHFDAHTRNHNGISNTDDEIINSKCFETIGNLEEITNPLGESDGMHNILEDKQSTVFQEIIDPRFVLLKLDIENSTKNLPL